jgi:hypothetical protein
MRKIIASIVIAAFAIMMSVGVSQAGDTRRTLRNRVSKIEHRMAILEDYVMNVEGQLVFSIYDLDKRITALEQNQ